MKTVVYIVIGILVGLLLAGGIYASTQTPQGESIELRPAPTPEPLRVHVAGAVVRPGVYSLDENSRVERRCGGRRWVCRGGRQERAQPGRPPGRRRTPGYSLRGRVCSEEDQGFVVVTEGTPSPLAGEDLVNINTASIEELDKLPGIGQTTAVTNYRLSHSKRPLCLDRRYYQCLRASARQPMTRSKT